MTRPSFNPLLKVESDAATNTDTMQAIECKFTIVHDATNHEVIYNYQTGYTTIFACPVGHGALAMKSWKQPFMCEDLKAAELVVRLYTLIK